MWMMIFIEKKLSHLRACLALAGKGSYARNTRKMNKKTNNKIEIHIR